MHTTKHNVVDSSPPDEILSLKDVSFMFPGNRVHALTNLSLSFKAGQLCFLLGENGAGKSTLAKLCSGFLRPSRGYLTITGKPYVARSPRTALRKGIALVPQHPGVVARLDVWQNLALAGHVPGVHGPFRLLRPRTLRNRYGNLLKQFGLSIELDAKASSLSAAEMHWLALAEALVRRPRFLFLDEPSAPYTEEEVDHLYTMLKHAVDLGMGVVVISHRLDEVAKFADRVVVLRNGSVKLDCLSKETDQESILATMFGTNEPVDVEKEKLKPEDFTVRPHPNPRSWPLGEAVLNVSALDAQSSCGDVLKNIAFTVFSGMILGIHTPQGRAMDTLEDIMCTLRPSPTGCLSYLGNPWPRSGTRLRAFDIRYVPGRRFQRGIADSLDVIDNIIGFRRTTAYRRGFWNRKGFLSFARYLPFLIPSHWLSPITSLSGGTIQRVILNRELGEPTPRLVMCFEPSWGLDHRLQLQMHERLRDLAKLGCAVLLVSSDRMEVQKLSDEYYELSNGYLQRQKQ